MLRGTPTRVGAVGTRPWWDVSAEGQRESPRGRGHGRADPRRQREKGGDALGLYELQLFL